MKKMQYKKMGAITMACAMTLAFAACGDGTGGGGGDGTFEDVYVTVLDAGFGSAWMDAVASAYFEETGTIVHVSADPDLVNSVSTKMGTNAEKDDIYFCSQAPSNWRTWAYRELIEPVDDVLENEKYGTPAKDRAVDNTLLKTGKYFGDTYLIPYVYSNWGLIYNQNYLNQINSYGTYEKGVWPETVQGLLDLCTAAKAAKIVNSRTGRTVAPFSCGLTVPYMDPLFYSLWCQLDPTGYQSYFTQNDKTSYDFTALTSDAVEQAMTTIFDLIGATSDSNSNLVATAQNHLDSQTSFVNGDCVFTFCGTWFESEMKTVLQEVGLTEYHYAAHPVYNEGDKKYSNVNIPGEYFFIPSDAYNVEGAKDFLAFAMSDKGIAAAERVLNQPLAYTGSTEVEFSRFGQEIDAVISNSEKFYTYSDTDVGKTGALDLFMMDSSPFTLMAKYTVTDKTQIYEKCIAPEIAKHQTRWEDMMRALG